MNDYSDIKQIQTRLKQPFLHGAGSVMSIWGDYSRITLYGSKHDAEQMRNDWMKVSEDIARSIKRANQ